MNYNGQRTILLLPYTTTTKGIGGIIKHLPEDFIVGEIIENNQILDPRASNFNLPSHKGLFVHGVLIKNNINTETALSILARILNISRKDIGYAGTKDKKALTAQRISIWGIAKKFRGKNSLDFETSNVKLKGTIQSLRETRLGDLLGNYFEITIRNITLDKDTIMSRVNNTYREIKSFGGIINGFDLQRFGDKRPLSHTVGKLLILKKPQEAVRFYIGKIFGNENQEEKKARNYYWKTENIEETLKLLPTNLHFERRMLLYLSTHPRNYEKCFQAVSRQFEKLFIHAYQAYLFNSYLIKRHQISNDFTKPIDGEKIINNQVFAPILGAQIKVTGLAKKIYEEVLQKEGISFRDLENKEVVKMGGKGTYRQILALPNRYQVISITKDELYPNNLKLTLAFELQKGSYATLVLREIIKDTYR